MQAAEKIESKSPADLSEYDAIAKTVQIYIDAGRSGRGEEMKAAFHPDATIFGYAGADLFAGPIQQLFDWNDQNGPATELQERITSIDLVETVATVRLELDNWTGHRFTDMFTLLKVDGEWKIIARCSICIREVDVESTTFRLRGFERPQAKACTLNSLLFSWR